MQSRSNNKTGDHPAYVNVTVAPEWTTFEGFLKSMGERPEGTTLGRILDLGGYFPGNVFWMTDAEQKLHQKNKRHLLGLVKKPVQPITAVAQAA